MKIPSGLEKPVSVRNGVSARNNSSVKNVASTRSNSPARTAGSAKTDKQSAMPHLKGVLFDQKNAVSPSKPNLAYQNSLPEKPEGHTGERPILAEGLLKEIAAGLGLPKDALSISLITLTRFLSMPMDPQLMKMLRREILSSGKSSSPETPADKAALEAEILARLSAGDKGVVLSSEALEQYSRYFGSPDGENGDSPEQQEDPKAGELKAMAGEQSQANGLLDFLNSLPGKNGQYWMVLPIIVNIRGIELKVFIRLLIRGELPSMVERRLIVDISGPSRSWRCFLAEVNGGLRADILVYPEHKPWDLDLLQKEATRFLMGGGALSGNSKGIERVMVQNSGKSFSWVENLYDESLPSINKEV